MKRWMSISVELLGGHGETFWPPPGRLFVIGPSHTFADLAAAVNLAFARWDLSHLWVFTMPDGTLVADEEVLDEREADSPSSPGARGVDLASTKVSQLAERGTSFRFAFDLGADWVHSCTVGEEYVDPAEVLGITPQRPTAYFGWGDLPDQYGRRWKDADEPEPALPGAAHPMLHPEWPADIRPTVDTRDLRAAVAQRDPARILAAVENQDASDVLQQVGAALEVVLGQGAPFARAYATDVALQLRARDWEGDVELAEDLETLSAGQPLAGRALDVDLEHVTLHLEGSMDQEGGYLDLETGEVLPGSMTDPGMVGEDEAVDLDDQPDRWLALPRLGSRAGWRDMALFTELVTAEKLREKLELAISGQGAFRRFRDVVHAEGLVDAWRSFSDDRQRGRARAFLADNGIRAHG